MCKFTAITLFKISLKKIWFKKILCVSMKLKWLYFVKIRAMYIFKFKK